MFPYQIYSWLAAMAAMISALAMFALAAVTVDFLIALFLALLTNGLILVFSDLRYLRIAYEKTGKREFYYAPFWWSFSYHFKWRRFPNWILGTVLSGLGAVGVIVHITLYFCDVWTLSPLRW
ncbi:MAG: hypothetical protein CMJ78_01460 [Planctomycetaceae bacterium]|nr:hypothetical protein [Planctomycetaceae bacterium]